MQLFLTEVITHTDTLPNKRCVGPVLSLAYCLPQVILGSPNHTETNLVAPRACALCSHTRLVDNQLQITSWILSLQR